MVPFMFETRNKTCSKIVKAWFLLAYRVAKKSKFDIKILISKSLI